MSSGALAWFDRVDLLVDQWTTRFYCARMAARWRRLAATVLHDDAAWALGWAALPRRIGMCCARARRRYRRRLAYLGRCRRSFMPERLRSKRLDALGECFIFGHDPANADDYTGNVFCSRCGAQK